MFNIQLINTLGITLFLMVAVPVAFVYLYDYILEKRKTTYTPAQLHRSGLCPKTLAGYSCKGGNNYMECGKAL